MFCSCGDDRSALCHPYYTCTRCDLDFDNETFYNKTQNRVTERMHSVRRRLHDTICKACRQAERDAAKGQPPRIDWKKIEFGRFMEAARRTVQHHAMRHGRSTHDLIKDGWIAPKIAEKMAATGTCEYCERSFHSVDDQTIDVVVPRDGFSWELNTRIACATCNNGKQAFEKLPNARMLIDRWMKNWRRWVRHRKCCSREWQRDQARIETESERQEIRQAILTVKAIVRQEPIPLHWEKNGQSSFLTE
jgi:hypothetical protein